MARTGTKAATIPSLLPLPTAVVEHHAETLRPLARQWLEHDRVPPVLLLTGIRGVGKREMSFHLAQWLLCERAGFRSGASQAAADPAEPDLLGGGLFGSDPAPVRPSAPATPLNGPCGECPACLKARHGTWVDFREIGPPSVSSSGEDEMDGSDEDGGDNGDLATGFGKLKIQAFRDLKASMGFGAHEGGYRIFLIAHAERMTPQAANSLLKLLEEPPPSWILILTASDPALLLPTLVSRCQRVRLKPFPQSALRTLLDQAGVPPERQSLCLQLGQGSWKRTLDLAQDAAWERRALVLQFLENPPEFLNELLNWAIGSAESMEMLIDLLEPLLLEILAASIAETPLRDKSLTGACKYVGMRLRPPPLQREFWLERAETLARVRGRERLPLNKKVLAQEILLPYLLT